MTLPTFATHVMSLTGVMIAAAVPVLVLVQALAQSLMTTMVPLWAVTASAAVEARQRPPLSAARWTWTHSVRGWVRRACWLLMQAPPSQLGPLRRQGTGLEGRGVGSGSQAALAATWTAPSALR